MDLNRPVVGSKIVTKLKPSLNITERVNFNSHVFLCIDKIQNILSVSLKIVNFCPHFPAFIHSTAEDIA